MNIKMNMRHCISFGAVVLTIIMFALFLLAPLNTKAAVIEVTDPSTGNGCVIADEADLLTDAEEMALMEAMMPALEYGNIMFQSADEEHSDSVQYFAEAKYKKYFGYEGGTCLLIDMNRREIFIFSDGNNQKVVTKAKSQSITDNCYKYASEGDYYSCAAECFKQIVTVLNGARINEPMKYVSNAILAVLIGMIICASIVMATMRVKKASTKDILNSVQNNLKPAKVKIVKTGETKTRNISSGGGGSFIGGGHSGGGGGFSGGGHSGGGGGHRF